MKKQNMTETLRYNLLMSANQAGVFLATIPAGWAAVCCSSHNVLLTGQLIMATATMAVPLVINLYWILSVVLQMFVGAGMAVMLPSVFTIMADWEHVEWKTTVICLCLAGRPLGQLASSTLISVTCHWTFFPGWIMSHFIVGFVGLIWCGLWLWFGHPKAPCGGCVYECCTCCNKEKPEVPVCTQRMIMMKVWNAVAKQSAVWGIVFAWSSTDLMWMLLETYTLILNKINFMNEIWTSVTLMGTCLCTVIAGVIADKVIDCNPESYRYIRKIFDSFGKVFVIILAIVMVRLQFDCSKWILVMIVIVVVSCFQSIQFAGCYSNCVDIGDPCTGVAVSMAMIFSSLSRLAMWNGLYYSVSFDMELLRFQPPLYAISAILGGSIVIYTLFGTPDVNLYLPADWNRLIMSNQGKGCCMSCCSTPEPPHKHIMQIMDQACRSSFSRGSSGQKCADVTDFEKPLMPAEYDQRPRGSVVSFSDSTTPTKHSLPTAGILRRSNSPTTETRVQFAEGFTPSDLPHNHTQPFQHSSPAVRPKAPMARQNHMDEQHDWPPPPGFQPIREGHSPRLVGSGQAVCLQRAPAVDVESCEDLHTTPQEHTWLGAESTL